MTRNKLIATYSRVSTARQEEEHTIKTQIQVLKEYAEKNDCTIVKEYIDEGWSGDILARPSLDELRNDAKSKKWEAVLIYDPDRLARRYSYQELVMDELREAGIEIIFITVSAPKNSEDKILHGVRGLFAEYERAKIAERFRLGKLRKVKDGHILTNEAPYGYRYIRIQDGKPGYYEIVDEEARIVRQMFEWIAYDGLSIRKITARLFDLGIKPKKSKRGVWDKSSISYLLRNPAYTGESIWGRNVSVVPIKPKNIEKYRKMKKTSRRARPESEWIVVPVPAIIDKELFQKVRDKLKENSAFSDRNKKHEYLLTGKIFCPCGRRQAGQGHLGRNDFFYRCTERLHSYPLPPSCKIKGVPVRNVDPAVWDKIAELMSSSDLMQKQVGRAMKNKKQKALASVNDTVTLEKEIEKLKAQEDRYNKAYGAGVFTVDALQEYVTPIRGKITNIQTQILKSRQFAESVSEIPSPYEMAEFANKAIATLSNLNFAAKRAIVLKVVDKVVACRDSIEVSGCIPVTDSALLCLIDRDSLDAIGLSENNKATIPFVFRIDLLSPKKGKGT